MPAQYRDEAWRSQCADYPPYTGPLGVQFNPYDVHNGADFYLWAPTAKRVVLRLSDLEHESTNTCTDDVTAIPMQPGSNGEWHARVNTDVWGATYCYELTFAPPTSAYIKRLNDGTLPKWARPLAGDGCVVTSVDPYARAVTANGEKGIALDPECMLNPRTWPLQPTQTGATPEQSNAHNEPTAQKAGDVSVVKQTPVIYELHVRDMTIAPGNGIARKGQYLGLVEAGTRTAKGNKSGLDYIADLGISHVQLLPVFDFGSVDELGDLSYGAQYNWGYDPVNYNAPEGSYASDPCDPAARVRELRALVDAFHARGIGVIMDVVYNHVWDARAHSFERTVPGYFFRMAGACPAGAGSLGACPAGADPIGACPAGAARNSRADTIPTATAPTFLDGAHCGNETASERPMARRFIIDSMTYWARVYGFDGFRVDLMGLHDVATMNAVRRALDEIAPDQRILLLGEGWEMGNHPPGVIPATQAHGSLMPGIAMFNDTFRDAMKGSVFDTGARGFISGERGHELTLYDALLGAPNTRSYVDASQSVVYNEAHDNQTVFDKLVTGGVSAPARRALFALQVQLLAHGTHFIHAGQEFCRTKFGDENSYRSPDSVNAFDYDRACEFRDAVQSVRELIAFRRSQPWLNETSYSTILDSHQLLFADDLRLVYRVRGAFGGGAVGVCGGACSGAFGRACGADGGAVGMGECGRRETCAGSVGDAIVVINGANQPWKMSDVRKIVGADSPGAGCAISLVARIYDGRVIGRRQDSQSHTKSVALRGPDALDAVDALGVAGAVGELSTLRGLGVSRAAGIAGVPALSVSVFEV